ncbi:MAG: DEAD/DEAH box helicase [Candidatus Thermoplasmatota archaeon]|nr:DEAD/DEAH box helicase [Candidatus Thermoplasmatota archaeon]MCL5253384.1 DEAD/DEAH box helicase [Candidatus Thermoplasmatota archaeon]
MTPSSRRSDIPSRGKPFPHVALLPKDAESLVKVLQAFQGITMDRENAIARLREVLPGIRSAITAQRMLASLMEFHFLVSGKDGRIALSDDSSHYVVESKDNASDFSSLIRRSLSQRMEWEDFVQDVISVLREKSPISLSLLIETLQDGYGYTRDKPKQTYQRYLSDSIKLLEYAGLVSRVGNAVILSGDLTPEIKRELTLVKTRVLRTLQKASRRNIRADTLRKLYHDALQVYVALKTPSGPLKDILNRADEIERRDIRGSVDQEERQVTGSAWTLPGDPYPWQLRAFEEWLARRRGIAKVVTGAGKTRLALMIIQELHRTEPTLSVSIVVPTIVLMWQWRDFLELELNVPPDRIGLRGGGYKDSHAAAKPFMIYVINSAIENDFIRTDTESLRNHLLIVDECHRAGAEKFRKVFEAQYDWSLGLSATPERERDQAFEHVLVPNLGPILIEVTYQDAFDQGIIPNFDIRNLAVPLNPEERTRYESLTREIRELVRELRSRYPALATKEVPMERFLRAIQNYHPEDRAISLYFQKTMERKRDVVYAAQNRYRCVTSIMQNLEPTDRTIVFHESIDRINELFVHLDRTDVAVYHSELPESLLAIGLSLYRRGVVRHLLSVKALIEGVDIPSTNIGIIMASSSSTSQRIQSLGRILRRAPGKDHTQLYTVYVKGTTDERLYTNVDWKQLLGAKSMSFHFWSQWGVTEIEPPKRFLPKPISHETPDISDITPGDEYPGMATGTPVSIDSHGRVFVQTSAGRYYSPLPVPVFQQWLTKFKPRGGRFWINEAGHITTRERTSDGTRNVFVGIYQDLPSNEREILGRTIPSLAQM